MPSQAPSPSARRWTIDEVKALNDSSPAALPMRRWVFLHGLMGYALNWRKIITLLGPNDLVLVYDQRGHGQSWKPITGYAPEDYAEDLLEIVREIGWTQFVLVGHSMGGRNALMFGARHPEFLQKLVIEDIGPESNSEATDYYQKLLDAVPTPFVNKLSAKQFFMNDFRKLAVEIGLRGNRETVGLYFYSNIVDQPDGTADWRFSKQAILDSVTLGRGKDHWAEFMALSVPTLVIRGAQSEELAAEVFARMAITNSHVQTVEIPNAGHWVHYDQPEAFVQALKTFVGDEAF